MILYKFLPTGSFLAGDTSTGRTAFAYASSTEAARARHHPLSTAREMMASENLCAGAWRDNSSYRQRDESNFQYLAQDGLGRVIPLFPANREPATERPSLCH